MTHFFNVRVGQLRRASTALRERGEVVGRQDHGRAHASIHRPLGPAGMQSSAATEIHCAAGTNSAGHGTQPNSVLMATVRASRLTWAYPRCHAATAAPAAGRQRSDWAVDGLGCDSANEHQCVIPLLRMCGQGAAGGGGAGGSAYSSHT